MPMTTKADGDAIRRLREARGLGCTHLADAAGIDKRLLSKIELGHLDGSPLTRLKIAKALGVEPTDFTYEVPSKRAAKQAA
jgi:transcriptional regulator with XRE-family HTH domain